MEIISPKDPRINPDMANHFADPLDYERHFKLEFGDPFVLDMIFADHASQLISPTAAILDIGSGIGTLGRLLREHGHTGSIIACDVSLPMLERVARDGHYTVGYHCDAIRAIEELAKNGHSPDWIVSILSMSCFSPEHYDALMRAMYAEARVGMIHSLETLSSSVTNVRGMPEYSRTYDETVKPAEGRWAVDMLAGEKDNAMLLHLKPIAA